MRNYSKIKNRNNFGPIPIVFFLLLFIITPIILVLAMNSKDSRDIRSRASGFNQDSYYGTPTPFISPAVSGLSNGSACSDCSTQCSSGFGVEGKCVSIYDYNKYVTKRNEECKKYGKLIPSLCENTPAYAEYNDPSKYPVIPSGSSCSGEECDHCEYMSINNKCVASAQEYNAISSKNRELCRKWGKFYSYYCTLQDATVEDNH